VYEATISLRPTRIEGTPQVSTEHNIVDQEVNQPNDDDDDTLVKEVVPEQA